MPSILVNRTPVLTLWTAVVAQRRGDPASLTVTIDRAVAGSAARVKVRSIGREERKANRNAASTIAGDAYAT
jgi:enolase